MNRVAIVVLNWNGIEDTLVCLASLQKQTYKEFEIIVVDNGSRDTSAKELEKYEKAHKNTRVLYNVKNLGFAGGVNTGIAYALKKDFEYVALFNNDATADKDWLKNLEAAMTDEIGITTGLLLHEDGKTIDSTGDWYTTWGLPFPRSRNEKTEEAPESGFVFSASGGASLYRTNLFRHIGLFDEDFFAYYEDVDISFRAQLAGWKVYYTNKAIAYHKQGATSSKIPGFTVYQTVKNLPLLYLKDVPDGLRSLIGPKFNFAYTMIVINAVRHGNLRAVAKGMAEYKAYRSRAISERKSIQAQKQVSDEYIKGMLYPDLPPDQTGLRKLRKIILRK